MTIGERIIRIIRGEIPDAIAWVPRMEIWYYANKARNTLPKEYANMTIDEIMQDIGGGYYKVIPDFLAGGENSLQDRALGIYNNMPGIPHDTVFHGVERKVTRSGDTVKVEYITPKGSITTQWRYTAEMQLNGVTMPWITEHAFKKKEDYEVLDFIFQNLEVVPNYGPFLKYYKKYKDKGAVVANSVFTAGPVHYVMRDFMDFTRFFYEMHDNPEKLKKLCESVGEYVDQMLEVSKNCPAELVEFGGNYDDTIMYPAFFEEYFLPYLQKFSKMLHSKGKFMGSHCDGENKNLLELLKRSGMDFAESVCPAPMTKCTLKELRDGFGSNITIFGGIPAIILSENQTNETDFRNFVKKTLQTIGNGQRYILGVSDNVPPDANIERLRTITDMVNEHSEKNL